MRAFLPEYSLKTPSDLKEALSWLSREPGRWKPIAGGTDVMVLFEAGKLAHKEYMNIWNLPELRGIEERDGHLVLGALTTFTQVRRHPALEREFPMLGRAASEIGAIAIQNRGTLGGNIVNASPAADTPPALLVYEAEIELVSAAGSRWVPYRDFHLDYKKTVIRAEELLGRIRLPRGGAPFTRQYYRKVGTRKAQAISKVCFAGAIRMAGERVEELRIGLGSIGPTVFRALRTEAFVQGKPLNSQTIADARKILENEVRPIDDIRSEAQYRRKVAGNVLEAFLRGESI